MTTFFLPWNSLRSPDSAFLAPPEGLQDPPESPPEASSDPSWAPRGPRTPRGAQIHPQMDPFRPNVGPVRGFILVVTKTKTTIEMKKKLLPRRCQNTHITYICTYIAKCEDDFVLLTFTTKLPFSDPSKLFWKRRAAAIAKRLGSVAHPSG